MSVIANVLCNLKCLTNEIDWQFGGEAFKSLRQMQRRKAAGYLERFTPILQVG